MKSAIDTLPLWSKHLIGVASVVGALSLVAVPVTQVFEWLHEDLVTVSDVDKVLINARIWDANAAIRRLQHHKANTSLTANEQWELDDLRAQVRELEQLLQSRRK